MANVIDINKVKRAMEACQNKAQLSYIAELLADDGRYNYRHGQDFGDNAAYADVEGKHIVAEGLRFADKQLARMSK